jgi:hypothetical protein
VGFVVDKVPLGQVFSEYFGFPSQFLFQQSLHNHPHLSSRAGTIGQKWPLYKGLSPTPLAIKKNSKLFNEAASPPFLPTSRYLQQKYELVAKQFCYYLLFVHKTEILPSIVVNIFNHFNVIYAPAKN